MDQDQASPLNTIGSLDEDPLVTRTAHILHHLNYRWSLQALALWKGTAPPFKAYEIYEGYDDFISLETLKQIDGISSAQTRHRLRHALVDHYLQRALLPHETEMRTWMRGAAAHVDGQKIYFRDIIPWCQKSSTYEQRQILQKETGPLCKFLRPFALNFWDILLDILNEDLGFKDYIDYCTQKKEIDYGHFYGLLKDLLKETDHLYFPAMEQWSRKRFGLPLSSLTRFDSIHILGLGEFDEDFPRQEHGGTAHLFPQMGYGPLSTPGLNLELGKEEGKSAQAMSFILQVPEEVYVLIKAPRGMGGS